MDIHAYRDDKVIRKKNITENGIIMQFKLLIYLLFGSIALHCTFFPHLAINWHL